MKSKHVIGKFGKYWVNERDQYHRADGPAVEYSNGDKIWFINDKLHREDGPAVEEADGSKEWFYQGKRIKVSSQEDFERWLRFKMFW